MTAHRSPNRCACDRMATTYFMSRKSADRSALAGARVRLVSPGSYCGKRKRGCQKSRQ